MVGGLASSSFMRCVHVINGTNDPIDLVSMRAVIDGVDHLFVTTNVVSLRNITWQAFNWHLIGV